MSLKVAKHFPPDRHDDVRVLHHRDELRAVRPHRRTHLLRPILRRIHHREELQVSDAGILVFPGV